MVSAILRYVQERS